MKLFCIIIIIYLTILYFQELLYMVDPKYFDFLDNNL